MNDGELKKLAAIQCRDFISKDYRHFDDKISPKQRDKLLSKGNISFLNAEFVKKYRHFPFITFDIKFKKYNKMQEHGKRIVMKTRGISLASHHDALLFKLYSIMLNVRYEEYIQRMGIEEVPLAYRSNHDNINGAKKVFDFIWRSEDVWIIKGDFHAFFDCLDHHVLLRQVKQVLCGGENGRLTDDWMSIVRSITKYRTVSKDEINNINKHSKPNTPYVKSFKQLGKYIKSGKLQISGVNKKGIPQGTAISAVLANVYMSAFDFEVQGLVAQYNGIYRRYSDDFVIVIPKSTCSLNIIKSIKREVIQKSIDELCLTINDKKTKLLEFSKSRKHVYDVETNKIRNFNYLGFEFTGATVVLRAKTLYKFHYRGNRAVVLLARNIQERNVVEYGIEDEYLDRRQPGTQREFAVKRLKQAKNDLKNGHGLRGRKQITRMYLVMKAINRKNMYSYAERASKVMNKPIEGVSSMYTVHILKKIEKEISYFQKTFSYKREQI